MCTEVSMKEDEVAVVAVAMVTERERED